MADGAGHSAFADPQLARGPAIARARAEFLRLAEHIERALAYAHGTHTLEDVWDLIAAGEAQLWPGQSSVMVTEIVTSPRKRAIHFWLCGGDLNELQAMREMIEDRARVAKIDMATTAGRTGWQRALRAHGYEPQWHICVKELQP